MAYNTRVEYELVEKDDIWQKGETRDWRMNRMLAEIVQYEGCRYAEVQHGLRPGAVFPVELGEFYSTCEINNTGPNVIGGFSPLEILADESLKVKLFLPKRIAH